MFSKTSCIPYTYMNLARCSYPFAGCSLRQGSALLHQHLDFYEIILITDGEYIHHIDDTTTLLPAGTLLLFKPGISHSLCANQENAAHFVLCIEQNYFETNIPSLFPNFNFKNLTTYYSKTIIKAKVNYIRELGAILYHDFKKNMNYVHEVFYLCASEFTNRKPQHSTHDYVDDIIKNLDNLVYLNMDIADIYAQYPYSETILRNEFKKMTGMTIVAYRLQQKIKYACQTLTTSRVSISALASSLNFSSTSYFIRAFEKQVGMSPTAYRKMYKK